MKEGIAGMKKRKIRETVLGDGRPKICVPLTAGDSRELDQQLDQLVQVPYDMVEFRADFLDAGLLSDSLEKLADRIRLRIGEKALLFTFRTKTEGGERQIPYPEYRNLNLRAAGCEAVDLVDLELFTALEGEAEEGPVLTEEKSFPVYGKDEKEKERVTALIGEIHEKDCLVIGSSHDFRKTPGTEEMIRRLVLMQELGVDVSKLAVMPQTRQDVIRLLDASVQMRETYADRPFVTMSMGELGAVSRYAGAFSGSAVTFATAGRASAPGQIPADRMARILDACLP